MRVISKFLTADVEIVRLRLEGRKIVLEGMIKGFMPMTVETDLTDLGKMIRVGVDELRGRVARHLPGRLGGVVAPGD